MTALFRRLVARLVALSVLAALPVWAASPAFRDDPDYLIDTWDTESCWPDGFAYTMAQTPDGYLWCGTLEGLVRFDGVKFRQFDQVSLPELPDPAVVQPTTQPVP